VKWDIEREKGNNNFREASNCKEYYTKQAMEERKSW
jgi:hypothetical protein